MTEEHLAVANSIKEWHKYYLPYHPPIPEKFVIDCLSTAIGLPDSELFEFLAACGYPEEPSK